MYLKLIKMVKFMLCEFYHNFKNWEKSVDWYPIYVYWIFMYTALNSSQKWT